MDSKVKKWQPMVFILLLLGIFGVISITSNGSILSNENGENQKVAKKEPFFTEDFNGLIISAHDVIFETNSDTGKVIMKVAVTLENTLDTSFRIGTPFLSSYTLEGIGGKLTGGQIVEGYVVRQTKAKAVETIEKRSVTIKADDMSSDDWTYIDIEVPDKNFTE